ncbi:PREDICTED: uncharacterized protein LOC108579383 isoform X2 [Habropoda laboriosa]|uniref:uncharacterized protein LOC108579383 isoform X2 n=1 Tax=Habropoda laboriosa TaxID=597456 RepID=UPI00083D0E42|nr:PREDICTED: uncharacterized protein LOC108579383 isoform X2 [Habropoda laboriosa]
MDYFVGKLLEIPYFRTVWTVIASVGWYLIGVVIFFWFASPYIREKYTSWKLRKDEQDYAAKYHKNPDLLQERLSGLEASRQKMQEEYYKKCRVAQEEEQEKQKTIRSSRLILDNATPGHRLGSKDNDQSFTEKKHKSIKGEYNPLMGNGSRGYRPPKRSCCGKGGGCG